MFKSLFKFSVFVVITSVIISCSGTNNKPIIKFSRDSTSIIIKNFDEASLMQVRNAYSNQANSNNLVAVLRQAGELDSLQDDILVSGNFKMYGDSLVFVPEKPFIKGNNYLIESFIDVQFGNAGKLISGNANYNLKPQKQILKR
ncbi:hypothetical protein [Pedobacter sp. Leaf250]|uniref:hypothetical protein n=1 Tax=Pedobacter sp. Leaf250 TaxID=2876559 RepID=UPI001E487D0D|nr:hypothetical protein [Pedobacter sp. Leaf250]